MYDMSVTDAVLRATRVSTCIQNMLFFYVFQSFLMYHLYLLHARDYGFVNLSFELTTPPMDTKQKK